MKTCPRCGLPKASSEFNRSSNTTKNPDGLQGWCRECSNAACRSYKRGPRPRDRHLFDRWGLRSTDIDELLEAQGHGCAICGVTEPRGIGWNVDHDHSCCPGRVVCGKCIRGVLCFPCNIQLGHYEKAGNGLFRDNEKAHSYLAGKS